MIKLNKAILTSFIILSILFLMGGKISVKAEPGTWTVDDDGPANFHTIQEAINAASPGDIIFVKSGTYYENVIVNKSVSLVGEERDSTIVDGNETGNVITITANKVSIEGFTIKRSGTYGGIFIATSSGNYISHNTITNNNYGIDLRYSSNNSIWGNDITNNNYGIELVWIFNNSIWGNNITNNKEWGVWLFSSFNNTFYHNNFIDNTQQTYIYVFSYANSWDDGYPSGGNYWSDYTGHDLDADGLGNDPYVIDVNNQDDHPLMGMFSDFNVTLERETYHVTTICNSTISEFRFEIGAETGNKIIHFKVTGEDSTVGFCRVTIPTELMNYPYIVLVDVEEIFPALLNVSKEMYVYLYFTYIHSSHTITIISSKTLQLYNELLDKYIKLQIDLYNLNATYYELLNSYSLFLSNYSQLERSYQELNSSHYELLNSYSQLEESHRELNSSYYELLNSYSQLERSYQEHLSDYSKNVDNVRNLTYIFAATTAIFIITTIYLSKHAHAGKTEVFESKNSAKF